MFTFHDAMYVFGAALPYVQHAKTAVDGVLGAKKTVETVKEHFEVKTVDPRLVDRDWLEKSGFQLHVESDGYKLRWSRPDAIPTRELDGYELLYEVDAKARTKRALKRYDGTLLIGLKV